MASLVLGVPEQVVQSDWWLWKSAGWHAGHVSSREGLSCRGEAETRCQGQISKPQVAVPRVM